MKYLTKNWYEICQRTGLHYGMRVHREAGVFSETLYQRLYRRKEIEKGYEVHVLFWGEGMPELILSCSDILMEIE